MHSYMRNAFLLTTVLLLAVSLTFAQRGRGGARNYNPATETTLKGEVIEITQQQCPNCPGTGQHLTLKTTGGTYDVHLGPTSYLASQNFTLAKGDQVEVTGSKIAMGGSDVILAREVRKNGATLSLRSPTGKPNWSGGPHK